MTDRAVQDTYPEDLSHCYGCGRVNSQGHQLKSHWDGRQAVARFEPEGHHTAIPGFVYGGLLASLIDCHGTGTASAAAYQAEGRPLGSDPPMRFVTASLHVDFLKPTPLGGPLDLRGVVEEQSDRKVVVAITIAAEGTVCVKGQVVAVRMPATMAPRPAARADEQCV
ncbi:PaaI family thioesterase [Roseospira visakhapatnamensis]|uniref:Acyl-coenzyme A thioesterase PaaI-like protein n=1 Tax=Roseospira visakhapatnamensis TaxID=390880 RepID=A0A7W6RCY8_9PROT|nr:PaaI family thioesterase [Roseospira visakhapatnamensis]MBB4265648.1 acyl-coenzyme A thioesterase PaaI-like protein [Roseospira visakhapatnamensis]